MTSGFVSGGFFNPNADTFMPNPQEQEEKNHAAAQSNVTAGIHTISDGIGLLSGYADATTDSTLPPQPGTSVPSGFNANNNSTFNIPQGTSPRNTRNHADSGHDQDGVFRRWRRLLCLFTIICVPWPWVFGEFVPWLLSYAVCLPFIPMVTKFGMFIINHSGATTLWTWVVNSWFVAYITPYLFAIHLPTLGLSTTSVFLALSACSWKLYKFFVNVHSSTHGVFSFFQAYFLRMVTFGHSDKIIEDLRVDFCTYHATGFQQGWRKVPNEKDNVFKVPGFIAALEPPASAHHYLWATFWKEPTYSYPTPQLIIKLYWYDRPIACMLYTFIVVPHMVWTNFGGFIVITGVLIYAVYKIVRKARKETEKKKLEELFINREEAMKSPIANTMQAMAAVPFIASFFTRKMSTFDGIIRAWTTCAHIVDAIDVNTGAVAGNALMAFVVAVTSAMNLTPRTKLALTYWFYFCIAVVFYLMGVRTLQSLWDANYIQWQSPFVARKKEEKQVRIGSVVEVDNKPNPQIPVKLPPGHQLHVVDHKEKITMSDVAGSQSFVNDYTLRMEQTIKENTTKMEALVRKISNLEDAVEEVRKDVENQVIEEEEARKYNRDKRSVASAQVKDEITEKTPSHQQDDDRYVPATKKRVASKKANSQGNAGKRNQAKAWVFGYTDFDPSMVDYSEVPEAKRVYFKLKSDLAKTGNQGVDFEDESEFKGTDGNNLTYAQVLANIEAFLVATKEIKNSERILGDQQVIDAWTTDNGAYAGPIRYLKAYRAKLGETGVSEAGKRTVKTALSKIPPNVSTSKNVDSSPKGKEKINPEESINVDNHYLTPDKTRFDRVVSLYDEDKQRRGTGCVMRRAVNGKEEWYVSTATHVLRYNPTHLVSHTGIEMKLGPVARTNNDKAWISIPSLPAGVKPVKMKIPDPRTYTVLILAQAASKNDEWVIGQGTYSALLGGKYPSELGFSGTPLLDNVDMFAIGNHHGDRNVTCREANLWDESDILWWTGSGED